MAKKKEDEIGLDKVIVVDSKVEYLYKTGTPREEGGHIQKGRGKEMKSNVTFTCSTP